MIIYEMRKPIMFESDNSVGVTGENLAFTQEFLIKGMNRADADYHIHLRFSDRSVNSVIPDSTEITDDGTKLVWNVKKNDIFCHGYFELQIEARGDDELVFQTEIVTLYADESIPVEDKDYLSPNSETLKLRDEAEELLKTVKEQQEQIEKNKEMIESTGINGKEDVSNKTQSTQYVTDDNAAQCYPSVAYLQGYYYDINESYSTEEINEKLALKADKATTLSGYGITDTYTQTKIDSKLKQKLDNYGTATEPAQNSPAWVNAGVLYTALSDKANKTDVKTALAAKADADDMEDALSKKYDSSNIETGSGTLSPGTSTYDGCEGDYIYVKIGKLVTVTLKMSKFITDKNYVMMQGLPFVAKSDPDLASHLAATSAGSVCNVRVKGSWVYFTNFSAKFADSETLATTVSFIV